MRYYAEITTKVFYETDTENIDDVKEEICHELEAGIQNSALTDFEYIDILEVGKTIKHYFKQEGTKNNGNDNI